MNARSNVVWCACARARARIRERANARVRERGAALVEAVVAIPFFVIVFAAVMFAGRVYETKQRVLRQSRERAWAFAMGNCGERGDAKIAGPSSEGAEYRDEGPLDVGSKGVDMGGTSATRGADRHDETLGRDFGSANASAEQAVVADRLLGGATRTMKSHHRVMCNEAPYDSTLTGVMKVAWQSISRF